MATSSPVLQEEAFRIATSFASEGHYAGFDAVLRNLLDWHQAPSFADLPYALLSELRLPHQQQQQQQQQHIQQQQHCYHPPPPLPPPSPLDVPALRHLWEMERRVHTFVVAHVASGRNVITLLDVEREVVAMLQTYGTPALAEAFGGNCQDQAAATAAAAAASYNPEDIDIDSIVDDDGNPEGDKGDEGRDSDDEKEKDSDDGNSSDDAPSFARAYGVGPLLGHPTVRRYFSPVGIGSIVGPPEHKRIDEAAVLAHLVEFLEASSRSSSSFSSSSSSSSQFSWSFSMASLSRGSPVGVPLDNFSAFVAAQEGVPSLAHLGVLLLPPSSSSSSSSSFSSPSPPPPPSSPGADVGQQQQQQQQQRGRGLFGLAPECQMLRHVLNARNARRAAALDRMLREASSEDGGGSGSTAAAKAKHRKKRSRRKRGGDDDGEEEEKATVESNGATGDEEEVENEEDENSQDDNEDKEDDEAVATTSIQNGSNEEKQQQQQQQQQQQKKQKVALKEPTATNGSDATSSGGSKWDILVTAPHFAPLSGGEPSAPAIRPLPRPANSGEDEDEDNAGSGGGSEDAAAAAARAWALAPWGLPPLPRHGSRHSGASNTNTITNANANTTSSDRNRAVGRWGEAFVFQLLLRRYPASLGYAVEWVNRDEETRAAYDLKVVALGNGQHHGDPSSSSSSSSSSSNRSSSSGRSSVKRPPKGTTIFVEVKSTAGGWPHHNTFDLSLQEWDFATSGLGGGGSLSGGARSGGSLVQYHIYRVFGAGEDPRAVRVRVVEDVVAAIQAREARLCLAV